MTSHTAADQTRVRAPSQRTLRGLDALNFFLADVRDGLGPYLAIYLIAVRGPDQGWDEATTGMIMTIAGIAGLIAQTPAGGSDRPDQTTSAPSSLPGRWLSRRAACSFPSSPISTWWPRPSPVAGIAGAVFPPALAAITLGVVGAKMFSKRIGRNEGFNHAGNAVSAAIAGSTAYFFGPIVVFWLMAVLAVLSVGAMLMVPAKDIDDDLARGLDESAEEGGEQTSGIRALLQNRTLMLFALLAAIFHLSNAAMLTSVGQLLTKLSGKESATSLISVCIVAAQFVMVPVAVFVGAKADAIGAQANLPRGLRRARHPGCALHLLGQSVLPRRRPAPRRDRSRHLTARSSPSSSPTSPEAPDGSNVSQGAVATTQGLGASFSATLAGLIIVSAGYSTAFLVLAGIAAAGFVLYLVAMAGDLRLRAAENRLESHRAAAGRSRWWSPPPDGATDLERDRQRRFFHRRMAREGLSSVPSWGSSETIGTGPRGAGLPPHTGSRPPMFALPMTPHLVIWIIAGLATLGVINPAFPPGRRRSGPRSAPGRCWCWA